MGETTIVLLVLGISLVVLVVAGIVLAARKAREREQLRSTFGPEYDRAVGEAGGRARAERDLKSRVERVARLEIRDLPEGDRRRLAEEWRLVQVKFVDDPEDALGEAEVLVQHVMTARGYPVAGFEQQAADLSVGHARVVSNYRAAHAVSEAYRRQGASTEDLRQAMVHYRALFEDLLGAQPFASSVEREGEAKRMPEVSPESRV